MIPVFTIFLFVHIISLIVGFGAVVVVDSAGLLWILGRKKLSEVNRVADTTQPLIWIGWTLLVISGSVLLYEKGFIDNLTWIKIFFVAMLGANGIFLHKIKKSMVLVGDGPLPRQIFFRIALASTLSQVGWWGALLIGFVHHEIQDRIDWPSQPFLLIVLFVVTVLVIGFVGNSVTSKK